MPRQLIGARQMGPRRTKSAWHSGCNGQSGSSDLDFDLGCELQTNLSSAEQFNIKLREQFRVEQRPMANTVAAIDPVS